MTGRDVSTLYAGYCDEILRENPGLRCGEVASAAWAKLAAYFTALLGVGV